MKTRVRQVIESGITGETEILRREVERLGELYHFAQAAVRAERLEQVFDAALDAITRALGTSRASILVFDPNGVMRFRAWRGLSPEYRGAVEGHSPWTRDAVDPQLLLVPDVEQDAAMAPYLAVFRAERVGALAFIPLLSGGRLLGKFMVYYDGPHRFAPREVELATAIGNHLASLIDRFAAVETLQDTIRYNELFAAVLAHDLRNPLGAMLTSAQLLLRRPESEADAVRRPLLRIVSSGERMTRMIEQLLDFTRARAGGGIEVQPRAADLAEICRQAVDELELANPQWIIRREVRGDCRGRWDPDRLLQVVSNLVDNAARHGRPGREVTVRLDGTRPEAVTLEVHNSGAIPAGLLPHLFDPFRRTRHGRERARGLGLGLFIVREVARAHGGTVTVNSTEAAGTTVMARLPRSPEPDPRIGGA